MWWLALLPLLLAKKKDASASSSSPALTLDADSVLARFTAGAVMATLYARPRPTWRVVKVTGEILAQGTARTAGELVIPMLEAFTDATQGLPIQAQMLDGDRWLSIFVFPLDLEDVVHTHGSFVQLWGWSFTDGVATVSGEPQDSRGKALLAAMARIEDGPPAAEQGTGTDG